MTTQPQDTVSHLERKVQILAKLAEISTSLNSQIDLQPLLQYIMEVAVEITDCEAASVLLWDSTRRELFFAASTTLESTNELIGKAVPMDSIAGNILRHNEIVQVDDAQQDPRHYNKVDEDIEFVTRSLLGVPMRYKNRVIGVLEALNKRAMPWTDDDRNYLSILAAQAAVAIQGAQLVAELKRANEELSELDQLKNNFIAIASHELRTPLGVIMGYASFLQDADSPDTQEHATKVVESALKLRKIIEDMVNLRYIKQKQSDLHQEATPVQAVLDSIYQETRGLWDVKKYQFSVDYPTEKWLLNVDYTRLMMAFTNLLNNAFSFTPEGGIVRVTVEAHKDEVRFIVADSGRGIEAHQLEKIFEEFYQVENHMTRHHGGLGVGLSIARAIVQAHQGRVWAESDGLGKGARFIVALPLLTDN